MKTVLILCLLLNVISGFSQERITPDQAKENVGKIVILCGVVTSGKYISNSSKKITVLNMGAAYPNHLFSIVIDGSARKNFAFKPEDHYLNKDICVSGKIEMYKNSPQIQILSPLDVSFAGAKVGALKEEKLASTKPSPKENSPATTTETKSGVPNRNTSSKFLTIKKQSELRDGPGTAFEIIRVIKPGEKVEVVKEKSGWVYIYIPGNSEAEKIKGFIVASSLQ